MKPLLNSFVRLLAILTISPLLITHALCSLLSGPDTSLESHSQLLSLIPGSTGSYLRVAFYRVTLERCAPTATICFGTLFSKTGAKIGDNVYIGPRCLLGLVTLEEDVLLGPAVQIPSGPMTHGIDRLDTPIRCQPGIRQRIQIGSDSWIGAAAIVLADVETQSVVGSGSIVTRPIPPRVIAAGNPARVIRTRTGAERSAPQQAPCEEVEIDG